MNEGVDTAWETELLQRIRRGDQEAFAAFYDRLKRPIYSLALQLLGNHEEAEEVLQDVFVEIWRKADQYDPQLSRPFSWVIVKTRYRALDRLRWRLRRPDLRAHPLESVGLAGRAQEEAAVPAPAADARTAAAREGEVPLAPVPGGWFDQPADRRPRDAADRAETLRAAFERLPAHQRTPIHLAFYLGMTHSEIAEHLREPIGTIKARIRRGLARMRGSLGGAHD